MLTSRSKSRFLLVKVRHKRSFGFSIPIALNVFNELLEATQELVDAVESFMPSNKRNSWIRHLSSNKLSWEISVGGIIKMLMALFQELQSYNGLKLVEVKSKDVDVKVEFF